MEEDKVVGVPCLPFVRLLTTARAFDMKYSRQKSGL